MNIKFTLKIVAVFLMLLSNIALMASVGVPCNLSVSTTTKIYCNSEIGKTATAHVSGGTAPITYLWSDGQTTATAIYLTAGAYSVVVTDATGCSATASAVVGIEPTCSIVGSAPTCANLQQTYAGPVGGGEDFIYTWSLVNAVNASVVGESSEQTFVVLSSNCSSSYTVNLNVFNVSTGCQYSCSQNYLFEDKSAPVFIGECANQTIDDCDSVPTFATQNAIDACDANPVVTVVSTTITENENGSTVYSRTWQATDACGNVSERSQVITVAACVDTTGNQFCTLTQGFYGNAKGVACATGERGNVLIQRILSSPFGPLVIGKPGRMLTITSADAACVTKCLPAGGPATVISSGNHVFGANCNTAIPVSKSGRFDNVLLGQTITLGLNLRMNAPLGSLVLEASYTTLAGTSGTDNLCGTPDDVVIVGSDLHKNIPQSVITALLGLYGHATVSDLFDLANRVLGGETIANISISMVNESVSSINEGFDGCRNLKTSESNVSAGSEKTVSYIDLFPNPFDATFTVNYQVAGIKKTDLCVVDLLGKIIYQTSLYSNQNLYQVDLSNQPKGMYLVYIREENQVKENTRIVKTK